MKCHKCGFVSFDYLSECKACGADLTGSRQRLGFPALKSEIPFLLGTLLKGGKTSENRQEKIDAKVEDLDLRASSGLSLEELVDLKPTTQRPASAPVDEPEIVDGGEDDLLIELTEADFEALIDTEKTPGGKDPPKDK